ncbi:MAG: hypothetical protein KA248_03350 [Kiritimatiellae bacterium]|nr:hypothetical protein [Kiritimatiellia bacterium]
MKWPAVIAGAVLALAGCRAPVPPNPAPVPPPAFVGRVIRVNSAAGFVVLQCERLPSEGETLTLYRGNEPAGTLRVTGPFRPPFVTADVVAGRPQNGDAARKDARDTAAPGKDGENL